LDTSIRSEDIHAQSEKGSKIKPKLACFSPPKFFGGQAQFLDRRYKIGHAPEHVAKFCGGRPRDLENFALKKNKELQ